MQISAIMERIAYKRGVLLAADFDGEEPPEAACQVVRFERGFLLVRIDDDDVEFVQPGGAVQLEVPSDDAALYRLDGRVEQVASASDRAPIAFIAVDDIERIQRRKQDRFEVNIPCRFALVGGDEKPTGVLTKPMGAGKVTDISLGGVELETDMELPTGVMIKIEMRPPSGRLDFAGFLVKAIGGVAGARKYGVKIDAMDTVTLQRLNRLVLRLERQERRQREQAASGSAPRNVVERRYMREHGRRRIR